jgi:hypothetical protein
LVASIALLNYLSKLALRIPDPKLSVRAKFLMYAMAAVRLIGLASSHIALRILAPAAAGIGTQAIFLYGLFSTVIGICALVFGVMYLFMLLGFSKRLNEAAASARLIWQASPT